MHISWIKKLDSEFKKPYFIGLQEFITEERKLKDIFPEKDNVLNAFDFKYEDLKFVIVGQDPYHTPGAANGLAFSVNKGITIPPSLKNIFKELQLEFDNYKIPTNGDLTNWRDQGGLLLNTVLTVEKSKPNSHKGKGWEIFTDNIIKFISNDKENVVFLLWGKPAQNKESLIDIKKHLVLKSAHPSPFSANNGFFGNNHFIKTNEYLKNHNKKEINWLI